MRQQHYGRYYINNNEAVSANLGQQITILNSMWNSKNDILSLFLFGRMCYNFHRKIAMT